MEKFTITKQAGCAFNDRIAIEFTPCQLNILIHTFKLKAENSKNYGDIKTYIELTELVAKTKAEYTILRHKANKKEKE